MNRRGFLTSLLAAAAMTAARAYAPSAAAVLAIAPPKVARYEEWDVYRTMLSSRAKDGRILEQWVVTDAVLAEFTGDAPGFLAAEKAFARTTLSYHPDRDQGSPIEMVDYGRGRCCRVIELDDDA